MQTVWVLVIHDPSNEDMGLGVFSSEEKAREYLKEYTLNSLGESPEGDDPVARYFETSGERYHLFDRVLL